MSLARPIPVQSVQGAVTAGTKLSNGVGVPTMRVTWSVTSFGGNGIGPLGPEPTTIGSSSEVDVGETLLGVCSLVGEDDENDDSVIVRRINVVPRRPSPGVYPPRWARCDGAVSRVIPTSGSCGGLGRLVTDGKMDIGSSSGWGGCGSGDVDFGSAPLS